MFLSEIETSLLTGAVMKDTKKLRVLRRGIEARENSAQRDAANRPNCRLWLITVGQRTMKDWNENEIACAHSRGGVTVVAHPFDNLIRTGCCIWPPAEIVQKLYQSRQIRAFAGDDLNVLNE